MPLSKAEQGYFDTLKAAGIVSPIDVTKIHPGDSLVFVPCGDGHHFSDLYLHLCEVAGRECVHPVTLNGGALLIPKESPLHAVEHQGQAMKWNIAGACKIKKASFVILYAHWTCGAAGDVNMPFEDITRYLAMAKLQLKPYLLEKLGREIRVSCFLHLHRGDAVRRTYHLSVQKLVERYALADSEADAQVRVHSSRPPAGDGIGPNIHPSNN